jgi:hypothetical protein
LLNRSILMRTMRPKTVPKAELSGQMRGNPP